MAIGMGAFVYAHPGPNPEQARSVYELGVTNLGVDLGILSPDELHTRPVVCRLQILIYAATVEMLGGVRRHGGEPWG